jgi:hypothetical protein
MRVLLAALFGVLFLASSAAWAECAYHTAKAQENVAQSDGQSTTVKRLPAQGS